jgi:signal peptidase I
MDSRWPTPHAAPPAPEPGGHRPDLQPGGHSIDEAHQTKAELSSRPPPTIVWGRVPAWAFRWLVLPAAMVLLLQTFVLGTFHVLGPSMENTLQPGDFLLVSKLDVTEAKVLGLFGRPSAYVPRRGEIVVFRFPQNPSLILVKRVIGLPSDRVVIQNGSVKVYDPQHAQGYDPAVGSYARRVGDITDGSFDHVVPADHVFVIGDNRTPGASIDSREWGDLPYRDIIGGVVVRLLPLHHAELLTLESTP